MPEDFSHDHVTVQVAIESTTLTPEQISDLVGTSWDEARHIGDAMGKTGKTWECNVWRILNRKKAADYPGQSAHDLLPVCMAEFCERLNGSSEGLRRVVRSEGGEFGIHVTSTFVPGLNFDPGTIRLIADLGLSMDVDVILYCSDED
jgi:alkylated DNA nucleotide flippase Atl1